MSSKRSTAIGSWPRCRRRTAGSHRRGCGSPAPARDPTDHRAVLDLISRYSNGYGTQDWVLFASIWADEAMLVAGETETCSAQRIVAVSRKSP